MPITCSASESFSLPFINEQTFIYCLTLFTFAAIWLLVYLKNKKAFFDRIHIPTGGKNPSFIYGHLLDVLLGRVPYFYHVWKYYNRFQRKKIRFGGVFFYWQPVVFVLEAKQIQSNLVSVEEEISEEFIQFYLDHRQKLFDDILSKSTLVRNLSEQFKTDNVSEVLHEFFVELTAEIIGFNTNKPKSILHELETRNSLLRFSLLLYQIPLGFHSNNLQTHITTTLNNKETNAKSDLIQMAMVENLLNLDEVTVGVKQICIWNIEAVLATTIFCLQELSLNYDIQDELIGEIRRFNKQHRESSKEFTWKNMQKMVYLDTVVKETFRKYPPKATELKQCQSRYKILDKHGRDTELPRGTFVLLSTYGLHHYAPNYPNPDIFDPDRFSEENKQFIKPNTFLPFGVHRSSDIEMEYCSFLVKLALIEILSNYEIVRMEKVVQFDKKRLNPFPNMPVMMKFNLLEKI